MEQRERAHDVEKRGQVGDAHVSGQARGQTVDGDEGEDPHRHRQQPAGQQRIGGVRA